MNDRIKTFTPIRHRSILFMFVSVLSAIALLTGINYLAGDAESLAQSSGSKGEPARIVYSVGDDIYTMLADGSNRKRLTRNSSRASNPPKNQSPVWSPDGQKIAFSKYSTLYDDPFETSEIYVISSDGHGQRRLTAKGGWAASPTWSPDGQKIAYSQTVRSRSSNAPDSSSIYTVNADGTEETKLIGNSGGGSARDPAWSPDGKSIAYSVGSDIYVMNSDGTGQKLISNYGSQPAWSPDGKRIAFVSGRDKYGETCFHSCGISGEIYVMNSDGTGQERLTKARAMDRDPTWSPDGRQIAFVSDRNYPDGHSYEIYTMRADGHCLTRLTNSSVWNTGPAWQAVGSTSAPSSGKCLPRKRIRPTVDVDLKPAKSFKKFPLYYLGKKFGALLLVRAAKNNFIYEDCSKDRPKDCPQGLQVQVQSACGLPPLHKKPIKKYKTRGVLAIYYGSESGTRVHTGRVIVSISPGNQARTKKAIKALRRINGRNRRDGRLPPPVVC